jgi:integrase
MPKHLSLHLRGTTEGGTATSATVARVATMRSAIKRDGLMLALYTGLRHDDVRTMRFDQVDFDDETVHLPNPKGGPGAAFTSTGCCRRAIRGGRPRPRAGSPR